jgi:hypothetical protein
MNRKEKRQKKVEGKKQKGEREKEKKEGTEKKNGGEREEKQKKEGTQQSMVESHRSRTQRKRNEVDTGDMRSMVGRLEDKQNTEEGGMKGRSRRDRGEAGGEIEKQNKYSKKKFIKTERMLTLKYFLNAWRK